MLPEMSDGEQWFIYLILDLAVLAMDVAFFIPVLCLEIAFYVLFGGDDDDD